MVQSQRLQAMNYNCTATHVKLTCPISFIIIAHMLVLHSWNAWQLGCDAWSNTTSDIYKCVDYRPTKCAKQGLAPVHAMRNTTLSMHVCGLQANPMSILTALASHSWKAYVSAQYFSTRSEASVCMKYNVLHTRMFGSETHRLYVTKLWTWHSIALGSHCCLH